MLGELSRPRSRAMQAHGRPYDRDGRPRPFKRSDRGPLVSLSRRDGAACGVRSCSERARPTAKSGSAAGCTNSRGSSRSRLAGFRSWTERNRSGDAVCWIESTKSTPTPRSRPIGLPSRPFRTDLAQPAGLCGRRAGVGCLSLAFHVRRPWHVYEESPK
jgi:hypothetical protein